MTTLFFKNIKGTRKYIYTAIIFFFIYEFLARNFGLNRNFCYAIEIFSIILFFRHPYQLKLTKLYIPFKIMIALLLVTILGALIQTVNPFNYVMGVRGQFLSMVFLFACATYLSVKDYQFFFNFFYKIQIINVLCTIIQYLFFHQSEDFNNGAFTSGATQDIFCGVLMTYYFYAYNQKIVKVQKLIFVLTSSLFIAIIQDERFIFIEIGIIFLYFCLTGKINRRKILLIAIMLILIIVGFKNLSSGQAETLNSAENILEYSKTVGAGYGLPRIGSAKIISDIFFNSPIESLFGIGLGKGAENNLPLIDTSFYDKYSYLTYHLFTFQNVFLQTGWSGIILYISFFIALLIYNFKYKRISPPQYKYLYDISIIATILCIILIWYNATLRIYYGIFPYFILGIGPSITKLLNKKREIN